MCSGYGLLLQTENRHLFMETRAIISKQNKQNLDSVRTRAKRPRRYNPRT